MTSDAGAAAGYEGLFAGGCAVSSGGGYCAPSTSAAHARRAPQPQCSSVGQPSFRCYASSIAGSAFAGIPCVGSLASVQSHAGAVAVAAVRRARFLNSSPVEKGLLLVKAWIFNWSTSQFVLLTVLVDSGSEVTLASGDIFHQLAQRPPVSISGIASKTSVSLEGEAALKVGYGDCARVIKLRCLHAPSIADGRVSLLVSAWSARALGLISGDLLPTDTHVSLLPELACTVDAAITAGSGVYGALSAVGMALPPRAPISSASFLSVAGPKLKQASPCDLPDTGSVADIFVAQADLARVLREKMGQPFSSAEYNLDQIQYGVDATPDAIAASGIKGRLIPGGVLSLDQVVELQAVFLEFKDVFATSKIPPPNAAPPVKVKIQPSAKPFHVPRPSVNPAQMKLLWALRQFWAANSMIEPNPTGAWASRLHTVWKGHRGKDGLFHDIRVTDDERALNASCVKMAYHMPNGLEELEKAAKKAMVVLSTDVASAFNGFSIHKDSREYFTCWLPKGPNPGDGWAKFQQTRMPFGWTNAPAVMQSFYDQCKDQMAPATRDKLSNYFDDFILRAGDGSQPKLHWKNFLIDTKDFLGTLLANDVYLAPPKTLVGLSDNVFYGFKINAAGGSSLSDDNVAAIRALRYPVNAVELRSVLGLLTQSRNWVRNYSGIAAPLHALLKKGTKWQWRKMVEQTAFDQLKQALVDSTARYKPDFAYPIIVECDASDNGIGIAIIQRIDGVEHNIAFFSRSLTPAERRLPIHFRECIAVIEGILRARIYAHSSPFQLQVRTDQRSLIFANQVRKGPLSCWKLAQVAGIDFCLLWILGTDNKKADFWSRYLSAPRQLSRKGIVAAVMALLKSLGDMHRDDNVVWVDAGSDTRDVQHVVQRWRRPSSKLVCGRPAVDRLAAKWDFACLVPSAITAPAICQSLLISGRPFACLVPLDLLSLVPMNHDGSHNAAAYKLLRSSSSIVIPAANQSWVCGGINFPDVVCLPASVPQHATRAPLTATPIAVPSSILSNVALQIAGPDVSAHRPYLDNLGPTVLLSEAQRFVKKMKKAQLIAALAERGADTTGVVKMLAARLAALLEGSFVSNADLAAAAQARRRREEPAMQTVLFYDNPDYNNSQPGERRFVVEQLLDTLGPIVDWPALQADDDCENKYRHRRASDNMMLASIRGGKPLIVVPKDKRQRLMQLVHFELGHNVSSMLPELKRVFYWKSMAKDVKIFSKSCLDCLENKSRIDKMHGLWRHRAYFTPRTHYSMDVKKIGTDQDVSFALVVVDRFSSYVICVRLTDKTTESVIAALMTHVVWRFGSIVEMTIDSEKGFCSARFNEWAAIQGIRVVTPLGYCNTANSSGEIFWKHYETRMRSCDKFPGDQQEDSRIAFEWNIQTKATGFTPFHIQHGSAAITAAVNFARGRRGQRPPTKHEQDAFVGEMAASTEALHKVAASRGNFVRRRSAGDLNRRSRAKLLPLAVGDLAMIFQPASGAVVNARGGNRNRKFVSEFISGTVTSRISNVGYMLEDGKGTVYYRHRQHLRKLP